MYKSHTAVQFDNDTLTVPSTNHGTRITDKNSNCMLDSSINIEDMINYL